MSPVSHPRVLFVTPAAFNRITGGGITFGNLFAGWPKDRLATAHCDPLAVTTETCVEYYRLTEAELYRPWPLDRLSPAVPPPDGTALAPAPAARPLLRSARTALFGTQLPDRGMLSAALERWIDGFAPQVLYTILGTNGLMELVLAIQARFRLPTVIHFMDDWPAASYRGGLFSPLERARMQRLLARTIERAALRLGICDEMCDAYAQRYGVPFEAFHNAVDVQRWIGPGIPRGNATEKDVVYVGSIFANAQLESLVECCEAVARLGREGRRVRLTIHSPALYAARHRDRLLVADNIVLEDAITDDAAFFHRIAQADVLLLPVNFDAATVRYIRYSMPTKLPAYLFSGTPVLAYGPQDIAQVQYLRANRCAITVSTRGIEGVAAALRGMLDEPGLRSRVGQRARRLALERHDLNSVRPRFQQALAGAVESARFSGTRGPQP